VKRLVSIALGIGLLASAGAAAFVAVPHQGPTRISELENFHLVGPTGRSFSIESFPSGSVLAIYFGYTICLGTCPQLPRTHRLVRRHRAGCQELQSQG
jgi:cytochrome oxidase Cu insertion factor (SCO1/SenC/PrrC family)